MASSVNFGNRNSTSSSGYFTESNNITRESLNFEHIKCILLGDGAVGKTSLIISYTTNGYPSDYIPTTFDTFKVDVRVEDKSINLEICDTAGQEDFDALRPLCFPNADAFILCFSVVCPSSFANIRYKWYPEIKKYAPSSTPIILVGTQSDLRDDVKISIDLANLGDKPISENQALEMVKFINAETYVECSALTSKNLKNVFDCALLTALANREVRSSANQHSSVNNTSSKAAKKRSKSSFSQITNLSETPFQSCSTIGLKPHENVPSAPTDSTNKHLTPVPIRANVSNIDRRSAALKKKDKTMFPSSPETSRHKLRSICCF